MGNLKTLNSSLVTITIALFFFGIYGLVISHSSNLTNKLKEKVNILIELNSDTEKLVLQNLIDELRNNEHIISESVKYMDKSEAIELISEQEDLDNLFEKEKPISETV